MTVIAALVCADPTVALRMQLLYVDWNERKKEWIRLGKAYSDADRTARWEFDSEDLR